MKRQFNAMVAGALLATTAAWWNAAEATPMNRSRQLDVGHTVPGIVVIIQAGQMAGLAWAEGGKDPCLYREYWYLSADYVYPGSAGPGETVVTTLRPFEIPSEFETPSDFFRFARSLMPVGKRIVMPVTELENCGADGFAP